MWYAYEIGKALALALKNSQLSRSESYQVAENLALQLLMSDAQKALMLNAFRLERAQ